MTDNTNRKPRNPHRYEARKLQRELGIKYTSALRIIEKRERENNDDASKS